MPIALWLAALIGPVTDAPPPRCGARGATVATMRGLPAAARLELAHFLAAGGIADAGERYDGIDVRHPGVPRHRFLGADRLGDEWVVHYESGGIATRWQTMTLVPVVVKDRPLRYVASAGNPCVASRAAGIDRR
jgi:hypothetical protein